MRGKLVSLKLLLVVPEKSIDTLDYKKEEKYFSFIFQCDVSCSKIIVAIYKEIIETGYHLYKYSHYYPKDEFLSPAFSDIISTLYPNFIEIYKQSAIAEHYKCKDIAGAGYRKALEFIVKDYAIKNNETDSDKIKTMPLSKVIETYIKFSNLKDIIKRAAWLGNDEIHYEKNGKMKI